MTAGRARTRRRWWLSTVAAGALSLAVVVGMSGDHGFAAPPDRPTTVSEPRTIDGVGAHVSPADTSVRPRVSASRAIDLLLDNSFSTSLVDHRAPTRLLLVQYRDNFGTEVGGVERPSVPEQLAGLAEYDGVTVTGGSRPVGVTGPPTTWTCTYDIALSATDGSVLDGFDFCR